MSLTTSDSECLRQSMTDSANVASPPLAPGYCTSAGVTFCKGNHDRCKGCPDIPIPDTKSTIDTAAPTWFMPMPDPIQFPFRSPGACYCDLNEADCIAAGHQGEARRADPRTKDTNPKDAIGDKKVPLWLCSPIAKAAWAVAQFVGMVKYGAWNWRSAGIRSSIYLSAMQRHLDAYMSGEEVDPVDQTPHLGHIMACAAIIIDAKAAGKLMDDRPPSVALRAAYAEAEKQMALARKNYVSMNPRHFTIADTGC